jgi:hypothetical protein
VSNFGKLDFSTSFKPTSAFPLDARCYFTSLASAKGAAARAEEVGSSNTSYYYGMRLFVDDGTSTKWYTIQRDGTLLPDTNISAAEVVLTNSEIELLNAMLVEDTLISLPEMEATFVVERDAEPDPDLGYHMYCYNTTATVTNIDKVFIKKAELGIARRFETTTSYTWYDADIEFGDTTHTITHTYKTSFPLYNYDMVVKLTYYSLIGGVNELTTEAVFVE